MDFEQMMGNINFWAVLIAAFSTFFLLGGFGADLFWGIVDEIKRALRKKTNGFVLN